MKARARVSVRERKKWESLKRELKAGDLQFVGYGVHRALESLKRELKVDYAVNVTVLDSKL